MQMYYQSLFFMHAFLSYVLWDWYDALLCLELIFLYIFNNWDRCITNKIISPTVTAV